jgi:UDP-N-acetylmuramyl pentapeptide phosphotransferase/UDP-N-acetylglucosamine-1-phosphate transferase
VSLLFLTIVAVLVSWGCARFFLRRAAFVGMLDEPNARSLHGRPTPRGGGLGIVAALVVTWPPAVLHWGGDDAPLAWIAVGGVVVAAVSLLDDLWSLPVRVRMLAQLAAAAMLALAGLGLEDVDLPLAGCLPLGAASIPVTLLFSLWMMNLYNFMDGMDGFAGGMGVFGFAGLAWLGSAAGQPLLVALALLVASANFGFLRLNYPPARIFMGDVGSVTMGYLVSAFALWGSRDGLFPLWGVILLFSPFIVDATATLMRRSLRAERVWEPHRGHYYQRLVRLGWGHRRTVLAEYLLMAAAGLSAVALVESRDGTLQFLGLIAWAGIYTTLACGVGVLERRGGRPPS